MEQLISIKNGKKQNSVFSSEEMEKRLSKLRSNMETENIDAILFTSIHNINYSTTLFIVRLDDLTDW